MMTPEQFVYWLQGFFELSDGTVPPGLNHQQVKIIKEHLALVMTKVTGQPQAAPGWQRHPEFATTPADEPSSCSGRKFC